MNLQKSVTNFILGHQHSASGSSLQALVKILESARVNVRVAEIAEVAQIADHKSSSAHLGLEQ